jgi:hypothetical protein
MSTRDIGGPLTGPFAVPGGQARLHARGLTITGPGLELRAFFHLPPIGRPAIVSGDPGSQRVFTIELEAAGNGWSAATLPPLINEAVAGRVMLAPAVVGGARVPLAITASTQPPTEPGSSVVEARATSLAERVLYDVTVVADTGLVPIAPHAAYHRRTWSDFGIAHITDMHVARRIDRFRGLLTEAGRADAARRLVNFNDRFRGFVKYANYLHGTGVLDLVVATGDLYDYIFENGDEPAGGGNAAFLRELILGQSPGPEFAEVDALRIPIFLTPGNHDYRKHPYHLVFDLHLDVVGDVRRIKNHQPYNLSQVDAAILVNRLDPIGPIGAALGDRFVHNLGVDAAARMVELDPQMEAYRTFLHDPGPYVVELGKHRLAMLDSGHDVGMVTSVTDFLLHYLRWSGEDEATFLGGSPNCEGPSEKANHVGEVKDALAGTPADGLFLVGLHAPLFNPWKEEYGYFLRETQRPSHPDQIEAFLARHSPPLIDSVSQRAVHPTWYPAQAGAPEPGFVKRLDNDDLLDFGVSRGDAVRLMRVLAGAEGTRPADVVLAGHTHIHNDFVVRRLPDGEIAFFMDFYTGNPGNYYPSRFAAPADTLPGLEGADRITTAETTWVMVDPGSPPESKPYRIEDSFFDYEVGVPPYARPLSDASDPRAWWTDHRPLVLQTAALGPVKVLPMFAGFRVLQISGDVITAVHRVRIDRLETANYVLPWEEAIKPSPPLRAPAAGWLSVSEGFTTPGAPLTTAVIGEEITVLLADPGGGVFSARGLRGQWSGWRRVSEGATTPGARVAAVVTGTQLTGHQITVLVADPGGEVFSATGRHGKWSPWQTVSQGSTRPGAPITAVATDVNQITVLLADPGGGVFSATGRHGAWSPWQSVSEGSTTPGAHVTAVAIDNRITVLLADPGGEVFSATGRHGGWSAWQSVSQGSTRPGAPVTAVVTDDRITVLLSDPGGEVFSAIGRQGSWSPWQSVSQGSTTPGAPVTAVVTGDSQIAVFVADTLGGVYRTARVGTDLWQQWRSASEGATTPGGHVAAALVPSYNLLDPRKRLTLLVADPSGGVFARVMPV